MPPSGGYFFWRRVKGFEEAGPTEGRVKKCQVDTFLGRGRIHILMNAPGMGVGMRILFVVELKVKAISKVYKRYNMTPPSGGFSISIEFTA